MGTPKRTPHHWQLLDRWLHNPTLRRDGLIALTLVLTALVTVVALLAQTLIAILGGLAVCLGTTGIAHLLKRRYRNAIEQAGEEQ